MESETESLFDGESSAGRAPAEPGNTGGGGWRFGSAEQNRIPESNLSDKESLNQSFLEILRPITFAVTILFLAFALLDLVLLSGPAMYGLSFLNLLIALSSYVTWRQILKGRIATSTAHPVGFAIILLMIISNVMRLALLRDPWHITETMLLMFGIGSVALSAFWLRLSLAVLLACWTPVALQVFPHESLRQLGITTFATAGLALVIHFMRLRMHQRLRRLRLRDEERQRALQAALAAAEHEIQERRRSESELRDSELRYRKLIDLAPVGICVHRRGEVLFVNSATARMVGVENPEEIVGRSILDFVHPDSREETLERMRKVTEEKQSVGLQSLRLIRTDGGTAEAESAAAPIVYQGEEASQAILIDITDRKKTHERLELVQYVMDHGGDSIFWFDNDSRLVYANRVACQIFGYSDQEIRQLRVHDLDPDFNRDSARESLAAIAQGRTVILERNYRRKDGSTIPIEITANRRKYQGQDINIVIARDITERKRSESQRRETEERFRNIFEHAPLGMVIVDQDLCFVRVNSTMCEMFGYSEAELVGSPIQMLASGEEHGEQVGRMRKLGLTPGEHIEFQAVRRRKDGSEIIVQIHATVLQSEAGVAKYGLAMLEDITEQVRAEEEKLKLETQLRQAQKMEAVGTLAGGIAHDFNNLLTGILGYSSMLKVHAEPGELVHKAASVIEHAAERARDLTGQLLGFARQGKHQNVPIDLHKTIEEITTLLSRTIDKNVRIEHRLQAVRSTIVGDPGQLQQVLLNLAVNARDAMPKGGMLTLESEEVELDEHYCQRKPGAVPGRYLMIGVSDTGCGIPREHLERIFDPFFTTKPVGQGTGMGLAMVYGIIKNHGGTIDVYSEIGSGSTFRIYLPLTVDPVHEERMADTMPPVPGSGRILVVDDEEIVRDLASDILQQLGYIVVACAGGHEAIDYFREHGDEIDLAIIDMIMPDMGGRECFLELRRMNPELKAILSTGYSRDGAAQEILNEGMVGFAQKPYRMNQLSEMVAEALS